MHFLKSSANEKLEQELSSVSGPPGEGGGDLPRAPGLWGEARQQPPH